MQARGDGEASRADASALTATLVSCETQEKAQDGQQEEPRVRQRRVGEEAGGGRSVLARRGRTVTRPEEQEQHQSRVSNKEWKRNTKEPQGRGTHDVGL